MLIAYYNNITDYLTETLGTHFIFYIFLITTSVSVVYFVVLSYIITQMDSRYFVRIHASKDAQTNKTKRHHVINLAKTLFGIVLLLCGVLMLVLPGQGLLTILVGLSLIPFPGKDRFEQYLLARPSIRTSLNWIRVKAKKAPFIFD
ncbi:MAG: hypothetical protein NWQ54_19575 [Paraglaciecola sp.]|uniref:hypothetical protein n=1 Tax=Pseudomonadati TaxID=3379134 RepID=UPI00274012DF|nr:hypothetical protein [Paraglaciecola sp.]MDP5032191.1 hypothetical protein [Paraglaciecola sp.]MDP5133087.1 hypothetical protein [Paraglaciecola sp.]